MSFITDNIVPEVFAESVEAALGGQKALLGTDIVVEDRTLKAVKEQAGEDITVPYLNHIGVAEEVVPGVGLNPKVVTDDAEVSTLRQVGIAIKSKQLARLAALDDPYTTGGEQAAQGIMQKLDLMLIEAATSTVLPATKKTAIGTWPLINDQYAGTPQLITPDHLVSTRFLFGDEQKPGEFGGYMFHSKVLQDLMSLKKTTGDFMYQEATDDTLPALAGRPIILSDSMTKSSDTPPKYTSVLCKKGALALWWKLKVEALYGQDPYTGDEVLSLFVMVVIHRYRRMPGYTKPGVALLLTK